MEYKETLNWMYSQLPMYQRVGKAAYKANLDNTIELLSSLDNPQNSFKAIHIAGTNGKGSVSHVIASILQEAGYKTGLYTSPHLLDFRERIRINGEMIPESCVIDFVENNTHSFTDIGASFFEMTVGMAFDYFRNENVDFAVIETGLGGRLDSTNLCNPIMSIITNITFDHMALLGDTIEKIAVEKAGIIKKNVPVVIGRRDNTTDAIFIKTASALNSPITFAEDVTELKPILREDVNNTYKYYDIWHNNENIFANQPTPLSGNYQIENIATAVCSMVNMITNNIIELSFDDISKGILNVIENTGFAGRWQQLSNNPLTICDTGHNIDGINKVVHQLSQTSYNKLHFILGMVNDKDIFSILNILPKNAIYYFCKPDIPRGLNENDLAQQAFKAGLNGKAYTSVSKALSSAKNNAAHNDLVFVGGSTFVVAEVV